MLTNKSKIQDYDENNSNYTFKLCNISDVCIFTK